MASVWPVPDWNSAESYHIGMKRFGANRPGGRLHAGCDLYAPVGSEVLAIGPGEVLQIEKKFLGGTQAIQVKHAGIGIVRYCEIEPASGIGANQSVYAGQVLGYVKKIEKITNTMLHIELFAGDDAELNKLPLTPRDKDRTVEKCGPYIRRSDLKDITPLLDSLRHYYKPKSVR